MRVGITVDAESTPTEHKGGKEGKGESEQLWYKKSGFYIQGRHYYQWQAWQERRSRPEDNSNLQVQMSCLRLSSNAHNDQQVFSPSTGKPSGAASTHGQQGVFCTP